MGNSKGRASNKTELNAFQGLLGSPTPRTRKDGHPHQEQGQNHPTGQIHQGDRKHGSPCGQDGCWGQIAGSKASAASDKAWRKKAVIRRSEGKWNKQ